MTNHPIDRPSNPRETGSEHPSAAPELPSLIPDPNSARLQRRAAKSKQRAAERGDAGHAPVSRPIAGGIACTAMRWMGALSLRSAHAVGSFAGRITSALPSSSYHRSLVNLEICMPELSLAERKRMARLSLRHMSRAAMELPVLWRSSTEAIQGMVRQVHGQEHLDTARANGRGLLMACPHLGSWEFMGLWFSTQQAMTGLYRHPPIKQFDEMMRHGRSHLGATLLEATSGSLRGLIRALHRNECVWMMPDQVPARGSGQWCHLFGRPALIATLLPKLAARTGATVVWAYAERLPKGQGFDIHYLPASEDCNSADMDRAIAATCRDTERTIRDCPEQYLWRYRRFRKCPQGGESPYKK